MAKLKSFDEHRADAELIHGIAEMIIAILPNDKPIAIILSALVEVEREMIAELLKDVHLKRMERD